VALTQTALESRALGAWQGRVVGCVLGRPVESGWSKSQMLDYLRLGGSLPLDNYIPRVIPAPAGLEPNPAAGGAFRGEIGGAPADDDTDFTILAGHLLEEYGLGFTTANVATEWLSHLTLFNVYTAERAVYRNLTMNVPPEEAAHLLNPAREFIGARIRADLYGFVCPGLPEQAATLAYRDAVLSHTKNGVYAAMFMAATLAWCYVTTDVAEAVRVGLSEIPANCRLAETIRDVLALHAETEDWEIAYDRLILKLGGYHPVHAINNTAWLVLALLEGAGDFDATVATAIMCGFDTDCNAANAGAVVGLMRGAGAIAPKWTAPLRDSLRSLIAGCPELPITEAAARTARLAERTLLLQ
jgi:ADP-ribosylglycohydrolase